MMRRDRPNSARGFSLIEAALSTIIVAVMFAAGMTAAGVAARDRRTQNDIRTGQQLARMLMAEICQQKYADPAANTIAPAAGVSTVDRSNWNHIDDYTGFKETTPTYRAGRPVDGATGWTWQATVAYQSTDSFTGARSSPTGGADVVGGLLGALADTVTAVTGSGGDTDTGLKIITVTVTSPTGKLTTLTAMRCSNGAVDRVASGSGFRSWANVGLTVGNDSRAVQTGAPLLNNPAIP